MKSKLAIIIVAALLFACAGPSTLADLRGKYGSPEKIDCRASGDVILTGATTKFQLKKGLTLYAFRIDEVDTNGY
jgi:hypothetical protein